MKNEHSSPCGGCRSVCEDQGCPLPRHQLADPGTLPLHAALHPGTETEPQQDLPGQGDQDPSPRLCLATTAAGRRGHLGTEMMRDLTQGAAIIMIKAPLQEEPEDNSSEFL